MRNTKIICTIGPASEDEATLEALCRAGMNVARLNFSHGTHEEHLERIRRIRRVRERLNLPVAIMLDTRGPEYRIKTFENGRVTLKTGDEFTFTTRDIAGDEHGVSVALDNLTQSLAVGDTILVNNGLLSFKVKSLTDTDAVCEVEEGGELSNRKSMNFPGKVISQPYLSEQDRADIRFGVENDRLSDHLPHVKAPGQHLHVRLSAVSQQRRQISGMVWMQVFAGVKMGAGIGKPFPAAASSLVDVKSEKVRFRPWKSVNLRFHHNAVPALVKSYGSMYRRMAAAPKNPGNGIGICAVLHFIAPCSDYAPRGHSDSIFPVSRGLDKLPRAPGYCKCVPRPAAENRLCSSSETAPESLLYFVPRNPIPEAMSRANTILPKMCFGY